MANFTCDICGGSIKMQANKTGVCQQCGMEYDIEAIRAMAAQNASSAPKSEQQKSTSSAPRSEEISREALLIYLNDVRTMETIIKESAKSMQRISDKQNYEAVTLRNKINSLNEKKAGAELLNPEKPNLYDIVIQKEFSLNFAIIVLGAFISCFGFELCVINGLKFFFLLLIGVAMILVPIILPFIKAKKIYKDEMKSYEDKINNKDEYLANNKKIDDIIAQTKQKYSNLIKCIQDINNELSEESKTTKAEIEKAYNLNIIPLQFRTIEGVYYLYNYLSTSQQSLSEALMQANLEAIKQRLDEVIETQGRQIILQAQTNAKLEDIKAKNQQILEVSEATMNNTAIAAKYAQIAAVNSELIARLSKKELAYQRADFWLK